MNGTGIVTSLEGNKARVKVTSGEECMGCSLRRDCHGETTRNREIVVVNEFGAHVSDTVVFECDSGRIILSAMMIWIIPLLSMIFGYVVFTRFAGGFLPIGAAFLFLGCSFLILRIIDRKISGSKTFYPRVTKIIEDKRDVQAFCSGNKECE